MTAVISDNESDAEPQREQVRRLCQNRRFDDAADLAAILSDDVLLFTPAEQIADYIVTRRPAEAVRPYEIAAALWRFEGTQATGSGEGIMAMDNLSRVQEKLKRLPQREIHPL